MKLRYTILLLLLILNALLYQQYASYRQQRHQLHELTRESRHFAKLIDQSLLEEKAIRDKQQEIHEQLVKLRQQLPEDLELSAEEQRITEVAERRGLKLLAMKSALYSRPDYREAMIGLTVEGSATAVVRFSRDMKKTPRIIQVSKTSSTGKKSAVFSVSIFSVDATEQLMPPLPQCQEEEGGIWLPPLKGEIDGLYAEYQGQCQYVTQYGGIYQNSLQLSIDEEEVLRLQRIAAELSGAASTAQ